MLYLFIAFLLSALALIALGQMSVWVTVLTLSLKLALASLAVLSLYVIGVAVWRRIQSR